MALKDRIPFGMSLPHRSPDAIDMKAMCGPWRNAPRRWGSAICG